MRSTLVLSLFVLVALGAPVARAQEAERKALKAEYAQKREALKTEKLATPFVELGAWCRERTLADEAKSCFLRAWELEHGHAGALAGMRALAFDLDGKVFRPVKELYERRRKALVPTDVDGRFALATYVGGFGLEKEAKKELATCIKIDPDHKPSRAALGFTRLYGAWLTAAELARERKIDEVWAAGIAAKQPDAELFAALAAAGYTGKLADVKAVTPFVGQPGGSHLDTKLQGPEKGTYATGEYCYGVPESYKPWRKNPLIVFLHGGGPGVGDGDEDFPQIWPYSGPRGYLTICPSVLEKTALAWNNPRHEAYLRALIAEFKTRYHVDTERTYLMGHSMGGFGCFYHGTRMTDLFAAISPWSGGPNQAVLGNLEHTPIYIIHGQRDAQVPDTGSKQAAKTLEGPKYQCTFVSLDIDGHGVPGPEQEKAVDWLERWTLNPAATKKK